MQPTTAKGLAMSDQQDSIPERARQWARGMYPTEAGVELLIRSGALARTSAVDPASGAVDVNQLLDGAGAWSGGEQRVVRIAAALLGGPPVHLDNELPGLDRAALDLVLAAMAHAGGSHQHGAFTYNEEGLPNGTTALDTLYPWPEPPSR